MVSSSYITFAEFSLQEVFDLFNFDCYTRYSGKKKVYIEAGGNTFVIKDSKRYHLFSKGHSCVKCGLVGEIFLLQTDVNSFKNKGVRVPYLDREGRIKAHFNLYGRKNGRLVLLTQDHIRPIAKNGNSRLSNLQTMCCYCNNIKGSDYSESETT